MIRKFITLLCFIGIVSSLAACNRVMLHSKDKDMDPVVQVFPVGTDDAIKAAKEVLIKRGYFIERDDSASLRTKWQSTKATSHYVDLFGRKDYGVVGAYCQIVVKVTDKDGKAEVSVSAPIRGVITKRLFSSNQEEKKILKKMADAFRKEDFEITNVGVSEQ
jgi:hypothetical protein